MASEPFALVLQYLRMRLGPADAGSTTDGQLLARFARDGEVAAFEALVQRHGPLVWRVCRRVLASEHDAEDAFQATFLVLVRKASSIRKQASVASWLYGVAHRIAIRARAGAQQRCGPELTNVASSADVLSEASEREVLAILEEELAQLPVRLRAPLLLCCLEGRSKTEAARQLGWREGTLASRLARARSQLRIRLTRRGVALSVSALASLLERRAVAVPIKTAVATMRTVSLYTLGEAAAAPAASAPVMALAKGALQAMFLMKLKVGVALALVCGILATGAGFAVQRVLDANGPAALQADGAKAVAKHADAPKPDASKETRTDYYGDPLPPGALARLGSVQFRHRRAHPTFSTDGRTLITAGPDRMLRFCDVLTGKEVQRRPLRSAQQSASHFGDDDLALAPGGRVLAACEGESISLFDTITGQKILQFPGGMARGHHRLCFSPDARILATMTGIGGRYTLRVYDVPTGKERSVLQQQRSISDFALSPDGKLLAFLDGEVGKEALRLWDTLAGRELGNAPTQGGHVTFAPDGKAVAAADRHGTVLLWQVPSLKEPAILKPASPSWTCSCLAFSPDGTRLAVGEDKAIALWEIAARKELRRLAARETRMLQFAPDGRTLASAGEFEIHLWDVATGTLLHPRPGHDGFIWSVGVSPDGKIVASTAWSEPVVRLWVAATGEPLSPVLRHEDFVRSCSFSSDGKLVVTSSGSPDGTVRLWEADTGKEVRRFVMEDLNGGLRRHEALVCHLSPDGRRVAAVSWTWDKAQREFVQISTWDARTGKLLARWPFHGHLSSCFTPDGLGVTVDSNEGLTIEETLTGRVLARIPGDLGTPVTFSPDGKLVAAGIHETSPVPRGQPGSGWQQKGIRVAEVITGKELFHLDGPISFAAFSPDGGVLATADPDAMELWDLLTGSRLFRRSWPTGLTPGPSGTPIDCLAFLPGARALATGMADGTVIIWDLAPQTWPGGGTAKKIKSKDLNRLWADLGDEEAGKAYRAMHALAAEPLRSIPLLATHIQPPAEPDSNEVQKLIADLDSSRFAVRAAAAEKLAKLGEVIQPTLRHVLEGNPSAEVRGRLEALLSGPCGLAPRETLRTRRAIQVLERIGTPQAQQVLEKLAAGAPGARETRDAKEALERMMSNTISSSASR